MSTDNDEFRTVAENALSETVIKRSRFICYVTPVVSVETASTYAEEIRKQHWDAAHNVPAWRIGFPVPIERFSDAGEPSGTAGMPVLEVLRKQGLTNTVVVVTRYFGGVLLGAGGLVRAYTESAVQGLIKAGVRRYIRSKPFSLTIHYNQLGSVLRLMEGLGTKNEPPEYGAEVQISGYLPAHQTVALEKELSDLGQGTLEILWQDEQYLPYD